MAPTDARGEGSGAVAGRRRNELAGSGAPADLAKRLRALRDHSGLTLRQLAARTGYSQGTLSAAEAGRRVPSWEVTAAFAQACGQDADRWRQLWELAAESADGEAAPDGGKTPQGDDTAHDAATAPEEVPLPAPNPGPDLASAAGGESTPAVQRARGSRTRLWIGAALACAVGVGIGASITLIAVNHPAPKAGPTSPPAVAYTRLPTGAPSAPYPVRRFDSTTMNAGERITLDAPPSGDWPRATSGSVGYDLEFTLADRLLVSVGTETTGASLALIPAPTHTYDDCKTSDYSGVVPTASIVPGTEFCVLTSDRRRALIVITAVHHDRAGLPDQVTLTITTWEHIVPPGS
jgi:transcriptional regulator with XRE-family HTH domain